MPVSISIGFSNNGISSSIRTQLVVREDHPQSAKIILRWAKIILKRQRFLLQENHLSSSA